MLEGDLEWEWVWGGGGGGVVFLVRRMGFIERYGVGR